MEIPVLAKTMELDNLYHIYLLYVDDRWCAFGCSAYYLSIMYPELDDFAEAFFTSDGDCLPFLPVTEPCLLNLSDYYNTLVSDTHIQVSVPPTVYSYRNGYDKWCTKLFVDKNKLHILKHQ